MQPFFNISRIFLIKSPFGNISSEGLRFTSVWEAVIGDIVSLY